MGVLVRCTYIFFRSLYTGYIDFTLNEFVSPPFLFCVIFSFLFSCIFHMDGTFLSPPICLAFFLMAILINRHETHMRHLQFNRSACFILSLRFTVDCCICILAVFCLFVFLYDGLFHPLTSLTNLISLRCSSVPSD